MKRTGKITKVCKKCKEEKDLSKFHKQKHCLYDVNSVCKICRKIKAQNYYIQYREIILKKTNSYNKKNIEKVSSRNKKWQLENKEQLKEYKKNYYKKYILNNKEKLRAYSKQYYIVNKTEINKKRNIEDKKQYKIDIHFKIKTLLRSRLSKALKNNIKSDTTRNLLGCSIEHLKSHLESQFTVGMNWDNYGKWHVDHIKPCASFDLSKPEQQQICFNYKNLQPLWAIDNLKKGSKLLK